MMHLRIMVVTSTRTGRPWIHQSYRHHHEDYQIHVSRSFKLWSVQLQGSYKIKEGAAVPAIFLILLSNHGHN